MSLSPERIPITERDINRDICPSTVPHSQKGHKKGRLQAKRSLDTNWGVPNMSLEIRVCPCVPFCFYVLLFLCPFLQRFVPILSMSYLLCACESKLVCHSKDQKVTIATECSLCRTPFA